MSPEERRYTAEEWRQIHEQQREQFARGIRAMHPDPVEECELGPFVPASARQRPAEHKFQPPPHVVEWSASLSRDDLKRLQRLIELKPETVAWIDGKNDRELRGLDGAVEFITSSRTAAKVLGWVFATTVTFVGGAVALAKSGYDLFSLFRGGPR